MKTKKNRIKTKQRLDMWVQLTLKIHKSEDVEFFQVLMKVKLYWF